MADEKEFKKLINFLEMCEEEYEEINKSLKKYGANKENARRMIFFTGGLMFQFTNCGFVEIMATLTPPQKHIIGGRVMSLLDMCKNNRAILGDDD